MKTTLSVVVVVVMILAGASSGLADSRMAAVTQALDQFDVNAKAGVEISGQSESETVSEKLNRGQRMEQALATAEAAVAQNPKAVCWSDVCSTGGTKKPDVVLSVEDVYEFRPKAQSSGSMAAETMVVGSASDSSDALLEPVPLPSEISKEPGDDGYSFYDDWVDLSNDRNSLELGGEWFDYTYREEGFMKLDGTMHGVYATYAHRFHENTPVETWKDVWNAPARFNLLRFETRYSQGHDIHYRSNGTGEKFDEDHYVWETRGLVGYDVPLKENILFTPYFGFGHRYLLDNNGGERSTSNAWSYDRESRYLYVPLGFDITRQFKQAWSIGFNVEYDIFWDGEQTSHMEDGPAGSNYDTVVNEQDEGYGLRGSVKIVKKQDRFDFVIEPFARYWHIKESLVTFATRNGQHVPGDEPDTYVVFTEPNNRTWEYGVRAGFRF